MVRCEQCLRGCVQALDRASQTQLPGKTPLFLCHRPVWAEGMAAPLMHPEFGVFLEGSRDASLPTRFDVDFAADFCKWALMFFSDEKLRQEKLVRTMKTQQLASSCKCD